MSEPAHGASLHYNAEYFNWYEDLGRFGGWANQTKFASFINKTDTVLDFGCGGGYMLEQLDCAKKIGIEVNQNAVVGARKRIALDYHNVGDVVAERVDMIISDNEHGH